MHPHVRQSRLSHFVVAVQIEKDLLKRLRNLHWLPIEEEVLVLPCQYHYFAIAERLRQEHCYLDLVIREIVLYYIVGSIKPLTISILIIEYFHQIVIIIAQSMRLPEMSYSSFARSVLSSHKLIR